MEEEGKRRMKEERIDIEGWTATSNTTVGKIGFYLLIEENGKEIVKEGDGRRKKGREVWKKKE